MIYFIRQKGTNYIKIGYTARDVSARLRELQTSNPLPLEIILTLEGDEIREQEMQRRYYQYLSTGGTEWFNIPDTIIDEIKGCEYERGTIKHYSGINGASPFDVRQVFGRQLNIIAGERKNVSGRHAVDDTSNQHLFSFVRGKH